MPFSEPPASAIHRSRRIISDPDEFGDVVSGMSLTVDFQRRQLRPSHVEQFQTPDWALDFGVAHVKTCMRGVLPAGWASLCLVRRGESKWNGQAGEAGTLCCLPPGEGVDGSTAPGLAWMTVSLPPALWKVCRALAGIDEGTFHRYAAFRLSSSHFARIERLIRATQRVLGSETTDPDAATLRWHEAAGLATHLGAMACELSAHAPPRRDSLRNRARLARRAEAWMRNSIAEPVRIPDICLALRVSRRELEYALRTVFDLPPQEFLLKLRVNAVRHALIHRAAPDSVLRILLDHGIVHPSRFAMHYRTIFGENPSETRRRCAHHLA